MLVHTRIEEEIFYPAVKPASDEISDLVDEGLQEHHTAFNRPKSWLKPLEMDRETLAATVDPT